MPEIRLRYIVGGLAAALLIGWGLVSGLDAYHQHQGGHQEQVSHQQDQEAQSHAQAAQAISDHAAELARLQSEVDKWKAKARRSAVVPAPIQPVPVAPVVGQGVAGPGGDLVARLQAHIADQDELIQAQDNQIIGLRLALADRTTQYQEMTKAFQHEQQARLAQEAATNAWKQAVKESRWRGRIEGFAAGVALGYAGGKL